MASATATIASCAVLPGTFPLAAESITLVAGLAAAIAELSDMMEPLPVLAFQFLERKEQSNKIIGITINRLFIFIIKTSFLY